MGHVIYYCGMANGNLLVRDSTFSSLAQELLRLGNSLVVLGKKFEKLAKEPTVKTVKVTPKSDPEMFTKEFINKVRQSRRDFEKGKYFNYFEIRKTFGLIRYFT